MKWNKIKSNDKKIVRKIKQLKMNKMKMKTKWKQKQKEQNKKVKKNKAKITKEEKKNLKKPCQFSPTIGQCTNSCAST